MGRGIVFCWVSLSCVAGRVSAVEYVGAFGNSPLVLLVVCCVYHHVHGRCPAVCCALFARRRVVVWWRQRCAGVVLTCACCTSACCQGWCVCFEVECYTPGKVPCVAHLSMIAQGTPRRFTRKGAGLKLYHLSMIAQGTPRRFTRKDAGTASCSPEGTALRVCPLCCSSMTLFCFASGSFCCRADSSRYLHVTYGHLAVSSASSVLRGGAC
jgi:hypothetical protein